MSDTEDTFSLVFIDLKAGVLCNATNLTSIDDLTDRGTVKVEYTFENLQSFAVFNAYGLTNTTSAEIITTNDVSGSLYSVLIEEEEAEPVMDNITVSPSTASVEISGTTTFTATAYDTGGSEMSGITFNWSVSDEAMGNVTSGGMFTGLSAGTVNVTASYDNLSGTAVVTVSETVVPTATPTPEPTQAPGTYGGVISGVNGIYLTVANDEGLRFDDFGNDTFCVDWSSGGGLNALHIAESPSGSGEVTDTDAMTGTFYATETGGQGYHDEVYLCVAVNGTISDDFRLHIISGGPQWTPAGYTEEAEYLTSAIDEWFYKDDFIYGPQTWKPAAGIQYPIFLGQDVTDASNTFEMMFIDLNAGTLDYQSLKIQYEIENLNSMLAFAVYGYRKTDGSYYNLTGFTNRLTGGGGYSGWYVTGSPLPDAASVVIAPVSAEVPVNGNQQFTATAYDSNGDEINGAPVTWTSSVTGVGTIDSDGLFTPVSEGSTIVTATSGSVSQTASVTVIPVVEKVLTTISLDPDSVIMYLDQIENVLFTAIGYDQFGDEFSAEYTWSSTIPVVGSINETGLFTGKTEGTTVVSATNGDISQTATVEIKPHPDWDVTLIGAINRTLSRSDIIDLASGGLMSCTDNKEIFWEGVNLTSVLALFDDDDPSSFNTTLANLDYNITIKGKKSGEEHSVLITSRELIYGDKTFITAYKMEGYEIPETPVSGRAYWPLKLTGTAIVNTGRNVEEISNITIEFPPDVESIEITSDSFITFTGGQTIQFAATAYDSADVVVEYIPFTWSVSDNTTGTIDADGLFTPLKAGTLNVTATYKSVSESVTVTVLDGDSEVTWTVDPSGNGDTLTIQGAIDYARDGDTIIVRDGTYEEMLTIDKGITLLSENGFNSTAIEHSTSTDERVIYVNANNVRISGFDIIGYPSASSSYLGGIYGSGVGNCVISENKFSTAHSLVFNLIDDLIIENNTFINNADVDLSECTDLRFCNNEMVTSSYPFELLGGSNLIISGNKIECTASRPMIYLSSGDFENIVISDNTVTGGYYGVYATSSSSVTSASILNNTIYNSKYGMRFNCGEDIEIADNTIHGSSSYSLYIYNPDGDFNVHNNEISGSTYKYFTYLRNCGDYLDFYANNLTLSDANTDGFIRYELASLNSTVKHAYIYNGETYTDFIGNLYNTYSGTDSDGNGFGDTPFEEDGVYDYSPLVSPVDDYILLVSSGINVTPATANVAVGESVNFVAEASDQFGNPMPPESYLWEIDDTNVGTVNSNGYFTARRAGDATITVSSGGSEAVIPVHVVPALFSEASNIWLIMSNEGGAKYEDNGSYYLKFDSGGLNSLHIATDPITNPSGEVSVTDEQSGTFYVTETGSRGYDDDVVLLFAANGTIPNDFRLHVRASGYNWTPVEVNGAVPVLSEIEYVDGSLDEWFTKDDLIYGPQTWKPAGSTLPMEYPIYYGQDTSDTSNGFYMMFIDLNAGPIIKADGLSDPMTLENGGSVKVEYEIENLTSLASFNAYAWCHQSKQGRGISWTNAVSGESSSVYEVVSDVPVADFTATPTSGDAPHYVEFSDTSSGNPYEWLWDFGDGTTSTEQNPSHTYSTPGNYTVSLTAMKVIGAGSVVKTDLITVTPEGTTNRFSNPGFETGDLTGWTVQNEYAFVSSDYAHTGAYSLYVNKGTYVAQDIDLTGIGAISFWGYKPQGYGNNQMFYFYVDDVLLESTYPVTSGWTQNTIPVSAYTGNHTVKIRYSDAATNRMSYIDDIAAVPGAAPVAGFTADQDSGNVPLAVTFTDTSENMPASWLWDFGDGKTSTEQNPTHVYTGDGTFTVNLTASNNAGSDLESKVDLIVVKPTEKKVEIEIANCTINGNGNGGNSVKVKASDAAIVNNSVCMQGNGFNLTIQTSAAPVVNGDEIEGDIENIVLETTPVTAGFQSAGNVSASVSLDLTGLPAGAAITTTLSQNVDDNSQSAFQLAASKEGLDVNAVAYTMNIVKTNLANGADIKDATISMAVSHAWVMANGGYDAMKIIRFSEEGTKEVLDTVYVGSEGDMDLFEAYSPHGLSIFGLAATGTPPEYTAGSASSSSLPSGGRSQVATESVMNIGAGETVSLVFDESAVTKIDVKAAAEIPELMLTVEEVSKPSGIEDAPDEVYQYVEITVYRAPEESIAMATLHFNIVKDWLDSISSTPSDVSVYHYVEAEEEWVLLSTVSDGSDIYAYNFFADTPGFSLFAITAKENTASTADVSNPAADSASEEGTQSSETGSTAGSEEGIPVPYILLATGLIIGIPAAGYGWLRLKNK
ncbi:MAG: Ig-like domain-containing protein [Dehalococcoidales bacterium]|nr:Ig-like domain-containing protein [Dehalococcoidales bacterium]